MQFSSLIRAKISSLIRSLRKRQRFWRRETSGDHPRSFPSYIGETPFEALLTAFTVWPQYPLLPGRSARFLGDSFQPCVKLPCSRVSRLESNGRFGNG